MFFNSLETCNRRCAVCTADEGFADKLLHALAHGLSTCFEQVEVFCGWMRWVVEMGGQRAC